MSCVSFQKIFRDVLFLLPFSPGGLSHSPPPFLPPSHSSGQGVLFFVIPSLSDTNEMGFSSISCSQRRNPVPLGEIQEILRSQSREL